MSGEYAVYIAIPPGEDGNRIARGASTAAPDDFDFSIREKGDPSESSDVELCFRINGVSHPQEAISQALLIYRLGRRQAGLPADEVPRASLVSD